MVISKSSKIEIFWALGKNSTMMSKLIVFIVVAHTSYATNLPNFPPNWSVHEQQYADVASSIVNWSGVVSNDQVMSNHPYCKNPSSSKTINCTATSYVDDKKEKSSYYFFEPNTAARGLVYFTQPSGTCYCDLVATGRWIQCEIAESLCNPFMKRKAIYDQTGTTTFQKQSVDVITWSESLIIAESNFRIYLSHNTNVPVQYFTTFMEGNKSLGYNQVNMTDFKSERPPSSAFAVAGRISGTCGDNVCSTFNKNIQQGKNRIDAFEGWQI